MYLYYLENGLEKVRSGSIEAGRLLKTHGIVQEEMIEAWTMLVAVEMKSSDQS